MTASFTCDGPSPGQCPSVRVDVSWEVWYRQHLIHPLLVQLGLSAVFLFVLHPLYVSLYYRHGSFERLVKTYLGTPDRPRVARPLGLVLLSTIQVLASSAEVAIWVFHTYKYGTTKPSRLAMLVLTGLNCAGWMAGRVSTAFELAGLWELNAVTDVLCGTPVLLSWVRPDMVCSSYDNWLSLHFLRSYSALYFFEKARRVGQLDQHTAGLAQVSVQTALRIAALLITMAGTILTCEVLGDPQWFRDAFIETHAGDQVSFVQMVYWIVVSITTVGYGDFSPRTTFSRILTTFFIVVGVASIYIIQYSFSELRKEQHEGIGRYFQRAWENRRHVVVILCHHGNANRMASLIHGFLQELFHPSHNQTEDHLDRTSSFLSHIRLWLRGAPPTHLQTWPDVVFLSPSKWEDESQKHRHHWGGSSFREFLESTEDFPQSARRRIWFLVGQVTNEADLARARVKDSALTYVLSDLTSTMPEEDDAQTIYSALVVRDLYPDVRLRLMVMKPESKQLAVQVGIETTRCVSSRELAASMLAQNCRCRGLIPAVTALLKSADADDQEFFLRHLASAEERRRARDSTTSGGLGVVKTPTSMSMGGRSLTMTKITSDSGPWKAKSLSEGGRSRINDCRNLHDLEKVLRKSQTRWSERKQSYERMDPWMFEYFEGVAQSAFGFDLHPRFEGIGFGQLCISIYKETGALLIGVQSHGRLFLCPQSQKWKAKEGLICFAICKNAEVLDPCRRNPEDRTSWRSRFQAARKRFRTQSRREGRHISAAMLIGQRLKRALLLGAEGETGLFARPTVASKVLSMNTTNVINSQDLYRIPSRESSHVGVIGAPVGVEVPPGGLVRQTSGVLQRQVSEPTSTLMSRQSSPGRGALLGTTVTASGAPAAIVVSPVKALQGGAPLLAAPISEASAAEDKVLRLDPTKEQLLQQLCGPGVTGFPALPNEEVFAEREALSGFNMPPTLDGGWTPRVHGVPAMMVPPMPYYYDNQRTSNVNAVREMRATLQPGEELIVLIVCNGEVWQQVRTFISTLRQDYLPCLQPLIILAPTEPPAAWLNDVQEWAWRVLFLQGSCLRAESLIEAGILEASTVLVFAGEVSQTSRFYDYRLVLTAHELECWLNTSAKEPYTMFELHDSKSAQNLPRLRGRMPPEHRTHFMRWARETAERGVLAAYSTQAGEDSSHLGSKFAPSPGSEKLGLMFRRPEDGGQESTCTGTGKTDGEEDFERSDSCISELSPRRKASKLNFDERHASKGADLDKHAFRNTYSWEEGSTLSDESSDDDEAEGAGIEDTGHGRASFRAWLASSYKGSAVLQEKSHESIMFHPRFAAGQIFTPELWGTMLGRMFYMPAAIELIEALVLPSLRGQHAFPWQMAVPSQYIGRTFTRLLEDLACGAALENEEWSPGGTVYERGESTELNAEAYDRDRACPSPPAVPIALYRLRGDFKIDYEQQNSSDDPLLPTLNRQRLTAKQVSDHSKASADSVAEGLGGGRFLQLAPPRETVVREGDWAIVIGGKAFGRTLYEKGLMRGIGRPGYGKICL